MANILWKLLILLQLLKEDTEQRQTHSEGMVTENEQQLSVLIFTFKFTTECKDNCGSKTTI